MGGQRKRQCEHIAYVDGLRELCKRAAGAYSTSGLCEWTVRVDCVSKLLARTFL